MPREHNCDGGWVCERHPEHPFPCPIFNCIGPGMPCTHVDCTESMIDGTAPDAPPVATEGGLDK